MVNGLDGLIGLPASGGNAEKIPWVVPDEIDDISARPRSTAVTVAESSTDGHRRAASDSDFPHLLVGDISKRDPPTVRREKRLRAALEKQPPLQVAQRSEVQSVPLRLVRGYVRDLSAVR